MKAKSFLLLSVIVATIISCKNTESDVLQQARLTQQGLLSKKDALLTDLNKRYSEVENKISQVSNEASKDSTKDAASEIMLLEEEKSAIDELRDRAENWSITNIIALPEPGQLKNDPKFKDMKDEDVLKMVKGQDSLFSTLKSEIESELLLYEDF
ncbi:MAG: hypothetical protein ACKO8Q_07575 [Bacteroidota bacterium]